MTSPGPDAAEPKRPPSGDYGDVPVPSWGSPPTSAWPTPFPDPPRGPVPGWVWPALIACGLVFGIFGGVLGGALVLGGRSLTEREALPPVDTQAPLPAGNRSVAAVAARILPSTVQVKVAAGKDADTGGATGSGFAVDREGHVITNNHVVEVAQSGGAITVIDNSGRMHHARVVGRSPVYDLAVLDVDLPHLLRPAALGSSRTLAVGDTVLAIGSPLGLSSTVTSGIVSALDRPVTTASEASSSYIDAVQTDAAINPGNSGGPLVNLRGEVVGVNSAIATTGGVLGAPGGNIGVGFAIPMEQVRVTAGQILDTGEAEYPVIGANVDTRESSNGALVVKVPPGTPAEKAGLEEGDRIVALDGSRVADGISLIVAIRTHRPGETVEVTAIRDGRRRTFEITLDGKVG